ncbi:hypothetical protein, partial [uncultured Sphingomonas sp.]|uniref:hypothetical protein n=1 Tax=uncultured Sphingomonas sp. TaxID=158754 RepID=UPI0035CA44C2
SQSPDQAVMRQPREQLPGYALWVSWADITASAQACQRYIEIANAKDKRLIDNARARRLRNG